MQVDTSFGPQDVDPQSVIEFPKGLLGFETLTQFKLFHEDGKPTVFWLQSLEDPEIQFSVARPESFKVNYQVTLTDAELAQLKLDELEDAVMLVTLTKDQNLSGPESVRANFMAPLVVNVKARLGLQKILTNIDGSVLIKAD